MSFYFNRKKEQGPHYLKQLLAIFPTIKEEEHCLSDRDFTRLSFNKLQEKANHKNYPFLIFKNQDQLIYSPSNSNLGWQFISPFISGEKSISPPSIFTKEVTQLIITPSFSEKIYSPQLKGGIKQGASIKLLNDFILKTKIQLQKSGDSIKAVTINHTHPHLDLISLDEEKIILHALSLEDFRIGHHLSTHHPYPISISAITATPLLFTAIFFDGLSCVQNYA